MRIEKCGLEKFLLASSVQQNWFTWRLDSSTMGIFTNVEMPRGTLKCQAQVATRFMKYSGRFYDRPSSDTVSGRGDTHTNVLP